MPCPHCAASAIAAQRRRTARGDRTFRCRACRRVCNERTGTAYNHLQYPTAVVLLVVRWWRRDQLSLRDRAELFLARGCVFTHETVRDWAARSAPRLRAKRRGQGGAQWHADETDVRVDGRWRYRYRAIDREGHLVDALRSERRDRDAAQRFFAQAVDVVGHAPEQGTTDGHDASPRASRETSGSAVRHRTSRSKNNQLEQDHRGIKQRSSPLRGFGSFASAARCCAGFAEQRQYFRSRTSTGERVALTEQRHVFRERWAAALAAVTAA